MKKRLHFLIFFRATFLTLLTMLFSMGLQTKVVHAFDTLELSEKISESLAQLQSRKFATVAFSRIHGNYPANEVNELIDFTNVFIVQKRRFRVIDRSKLQLILKEQKLNLSELITIDTYKKLGELLGVDLFLYGKFYDSVLILKAIDVETSAIVWSEIFDVNENNHSSRGIYGSLAGQMVNSLRKDINRFKLNKIQQVSFWGLDGQDLNADEAIDYLSTALTKDGNLQVIDRENLELILREQKLGLQGMIDENQAKRMGELYGIDAFFYGKLTRRQGDRWIASLKMMNLYNGVIEWADLISFQDTSQPTENTFLTEEQNPPPTKKLEVSKSEMAFIKGGSFIIGNLQRSSIAFYPQRYAKIKSFYIDKTEVSNRQYHEFVQKYKHRPPPTWVGGEIPRGQNDWPVTMINLQDAIKYCKKQKKRLPTEPEWEKAYRGESGRKYPWKREVFRKGMARTKEDKEKNPVPVFSRNSDVSSYAVLHMAGNVREWVSSVFRPWPGNKTKHSRHYRDGVIRGGSWATSADRAVGWYRVNSRKTLGWPDVGFRCAKGAPQ